MDTLWAIIKEMGETGNDQTIQSVLEKAVANGASDIHIEPTVKGAQVRQRVDGKLSELLTLDAAVYEALIIDTKTQAHLNTESRNTLQDSTFSFSANNNSYTAHITVVPMVEGEKIVIHISAELHETPSLQELGFWGDALESLTEATETGKGLIIATGPIGSGKATTLHSLLAKLNSTSLNVSSVEEVVERKIQGVNQSQVNPKSGITLAAGLSALLRQDANVIMVGDLRDNETTDLAVQAALSGRLVLTTLHTDTAAAGVKRLNDMGVQPFLIASTLKAIVGQRLVRRLDPAQCEEYTPSGDEISAIEKAFGVSGEDWQELFNQLVLIDESKSFSTVNDIKLYKPKEGQSGFKGRIGIEEVLPFTPTLQKMIVAGGTTEAIHNQAVSEGMISMKLDGLVKVLLGQTTVEEVLQALRD